VGDVLHLREWYPYETSNVITGDSPTSNVITGDSPTDVYIAKLEPHFTGRSLTVRVTHKTSGGQWGLPEGLCVLGISTHAPKRDEGE
jgi:hypothetical protein